MDYAVVCPAAGTEAELVAASAHPPFCEDALACIDALSKEILSSPGSKAFPELVAMAFWMRRANITGLKEEYYTPHGVRQPRGIIFHIAPSNVDTIFVYSLFVSLLMGNKNIVRVSSTTNAQIDFLLEVMNKVLTRFDAVRRSLLIVRYEHDETITSHFSQLCSMRVIWGGDETIRQIREVGLPPGAHEITFADKFSLCVMRAEAFLESSDKQSLIDAFYNDAFWFSQNACSSPRLVVWVGDANDAVARARDEFWSMMHGKAERQALEWEPGAVMEKTISQYASAFMREDCKIEAGPSNLISRVFFESVEAIVREDHCGCGLFWETALPSLTDLVPVVGKKDQTMTAFGFSPDELKSFASDTALQGIDRIVPVGKALEFSVIWDGYNLFEEFSREVDIQL